MAEEAALTRACPGALLDTNHDGVRKFHMRHQPGWTLTGADESNPRVAGQLPPPPFPPSLGQSYVIWSPHVWLSGILLLSPFRSKYISICSRYGRETSAFPSSRTGWSVCSEWLHSKADTKGCSHPADYILLHGQFLSWSCLKHPHTPAFWNKHVRHLSSYLPTWPRSESAGWK